MPESSALPLRKSSTTVLSSAPISPALAEGPQVNSPDAEDKLDSASYQTRISEIAIPDAGTLRIRSLFDREQFYDPKGTAKSLGISSALWPLFGMVWRSGVHLAAHVATRPVNPDERMLEIGCGLALASLVAHSRGANITASDRHPLAPVFLRDNLRLNQLPPTLPYRHGQWGMTSVLPELEIGVSLLAGRYDLIMGSDVLYERGVARTLAGFIDVHAALENAEIWIVDADRGYRPAFTRHMAGHGFALAEQIRIREPEDGAGRPRYKGRLLVYRR